MMDDNNGIDRINISNFSVIANDSTTPSIASAIVIPCLYILAGLAGSIGNGIVILVILRTRKLNGKIFLLLINLALADCIKGVAYLLAGANRLDLFRNNANVALDKSKTAFDCMRYVSTTFFILGPQAINLMTIFVTLDRLIAVAFPLIYSRFSRKYAYGTISLCWIFVGCSYSVAWIESYRLSPIKMFSELCIASWSFSTGYNKFMFGFEAASTWICFCLLLGAFFSVRRPPAAPISTRPSYYRRQVKVTKMLLISLVFVVILWMAPTNVIFVMTAMVKNGRTKFFDVNIAPIMWLMVAFSGCTNVFVYAWLNKRIRAGLVDLFESILNVLMFLLRCKKFKKIKNTGNNHNRIIKTNRLISGYNSNNRNNYSATSTHLENSARLISGTMANGRCSCSV